MLRVSSSAAALVIAAGASAQAGFVLNWARTEIDPTLAEARWTRVLPHPDGRFVAAGYERPTGGSNRAVIALLRLDGTSVWRRVVAGSPSSASLKIDELRILPGGDVLVTGIGGMGLLGRYNGLTGAVINETIIAEQTEASALSPQGHAFFAGIRDEVIDNSTGGDEDVLTRHFLRLTRVANSLAVTTREEPWSESRVINDSQGSSSVLRAPRGMRFAFDRSGAACFMGVSGAIYQDSNANQGSIQDFLGVKFEPGGAASWVQRTRRVYDSLAGSWLPVVNYRGGTFGLNWQGDFVFNIWHQVANSQTGNFDNLFDSVRFQSADGATSIAAELPQLQREFFAGAGTMYGDYTNAEGSYRETRKLDPATGAVIWSRQAGAQDRLPWQLMGVYQRRDLTLNPPADLLRVERHRDSDGSLIDFREFLVGTAETWSVAQQPGTGDALIVGSRLMSAGRPGRWVARLTQAPQPEADAFSTPKNTPLALPRSLLTRNDRFAVGASFAQVIRTQNGRLFYSGTENMNYIPDRGFTGTDTFQYRLQRTSVPASAPVTVTITVTP